MKLFTNPEIKKFTVIYSVIGLIFCIVCYIIEPVTVFPALIFCIISLSVFLLLTKNRYKNIEKLTDSIDKILQGKDILTINEFKEGELSILETQIEKMFIRLSEQRDLLNKEKNFLADSIADLSHQLRTPLTSINLILTLLQDCDITEERRESLLRELSSLISRTEKLITALLKISKIDAGTIQFEKQEIDASILIKKAVEPLLIPMDIKNICILTDCENVSFTGDFIWFSEALSNIIKNAVEHTPENGTIGINAQNNPLYTEITVTDTGNGFDEEDIPHIFERFYKGKNTSKESFGIGLNLAMSIIQNQNGTIKAENIKNGGAKFVIKIYKL